MSDTDQKIDRTNELLEELVTIQKDVRERQIKFLGLYKKVLLVLAVLLVAYLALSVYLL